MTQSVFFLFEKSTGIYQPAPRWRLHLRGNIRTGSAFIELLCSLSISELRPARGEATRFILPGSCVEIIPEEDIQPGDIIMPKSKGEVVRVLDGPLMKLSTYVSSIDFKSRTAILDKDICKAHKIHLGIRLPKDCAK